jgi:hypothetical protein
MRERIKRAGFILIIVGTVGLLLNEFAWEHSLACTITFAAVNLVGLGTLAFVHFDMKRKSRLA